ncbi:peptide N-acetyl-beta-D-glucosaminyl asparaginase amidase A-domain-containing protein [Limtongia smithiae]|uniref:peptide N-acetyl-beta-D-glucosaminyl asparaginase amidase A-domain-containing protein n=1 Tax=Limtongia smithiae TaxID=1125753 RepID=UPI0034CFAA35
MTSCVPRPPVPSASPPRSRMRWPALITFVALALLLLLGLPRHDAGVVPAITPNGLLASATAPPLEVFEVYQAPTPPGTLVHSAVLMRHVFAFSYGKPFVGPYEPPAVDFTHVYVSLSTTSAGRQFDRLALLFLGDSEIWRTSTAEPTQNGIHFQYTKDVSRFRALLLQSQTLVFELGNLVDDTYTGLFDMVLTAQFYNCPEQAELHATTITPISTRSGALGKPSHYVLPQNRARETIKFPATVYKAIALVSASGNAAEEFWYTNAVSKYKNSYPGGTLDGRGPHREIQIFVAGRLAYSTFVFPVIFTGGISPGLWRPIVGIYAYDLPMYEVDLTPMLPYLWDGAEVEVKIDSGDPDEASVGSNWIVSANIFSWEGDLQGSGAVLDWKVDPFQTTSSAIQSADKDVLNITTSAARSGFIRSRLQFGPNHEPSEYAMQWTISSDNFQIYSDSGKRQLVDASIHIKESSTVLGERSASYPLQVDSMYDFTPSLYIKAVLSHGIVEDTRSADIALQTHQSGNAYYLARDENGNGPFGGGSTDQAYEKLRGNAQYWRNVRAVNGRVVRDLEMSHSGNDDADMVVTELETDQTMSSPNAQDFIPACMLAYDAQFATADFTAADADGGARECIRRMLGRRPLFL